MAPRIYSRHMFCTAQQDALGRLFLSEREKYAYRALSDNRMHLVAEGDTLWTLASKYFKPLPRPAGFWWVIADFQPDPIFDPTIRLAPNSLLVIPSIPTLVTEILGEGRRVVESV